MYESMIKCRGKPILPPVMTQDRRTEARLYRNEAVRREQLRVQRRETDETLVHECEGSLERKLIRWRSEEEPMGVVQPPGRENGTSPSRIPRSASAQANLHLSRPSTQVRSRLLVDKDPSARRLRHEGPPVVPRKSRSRRQPSLEASSVEQQLCESPTKLERGGTFIVSSDALDEKPQAADLDDMTEQMRSEMCLNDDNVPGLLESDSPSYESATEEDFSFTLSADLSNTRDDTAAVSTVDEVSALLPESEVESQIPRRPSSLSMHTPLESPEKDVDEQGHDGCESRKCLGRRHTYLILQAKQKTPTLSIAPTPEENHLQDLAERLQSCAHLVSSLTPKNSPLTNKSLASLHESFRLATSSTQSPQTCDDLNANRLGLGNSRRVERRLWSDRNGNRGLQDVLRQHLDPATARGFDKFTALCKGHLCRKLLGCSTVQGVIGTITEPILIVHVCLQAWMHIKRNQCLLLRMDCTVRHDMVQMAFELHQLDEENEPNDLDVELHERVLLTLDDSCQELYRIFFEASTAEQIQLIREADADRTTAGRYKAPVKRLSSATLKRRIRLQKDADLKRNPPSPFRRRCCGSNRNHPH